MIKGAYNKKKNVQTVNGVVTNMQTLRIVTLGVIENYYFLLFISMGIGIVYFVIQPMVKWLLRLQAFKLLSYLICSLLTLILYFMIVVFVGDLQHVATQYFKLTLQAAAIYGGFLLLLNCIHYLFKSKQKSV